MQHGKSYAPPSYNGVNNANNDGDDVHTNVEHQKLAVLPDLPQTE